MRVVNSSYILLWSKPIWVAISTFPIKICVPPTCTHRVGQKDSTNFSSTEGATTTILVVPKNCLLEASPIRPRTGLALREIQHCMVFIIYWVFPWMLLLYTRQGPLPSESVMYTEKWIKKVQHATKNYNKNSEQSLKGVSMLIEVKSDSV